MRAHLVDVATKAPEVAKAAESTSAQLKAVSDSLAGVLESTKAMEGWAQQVIQACAQAPESASWRKS